MSATPETPSRASFWNRRIITPILAQMKQGITADKIAVTIALGFALSIFPILGATTILCALAGIVFRLNQPIIQMVNYFAYPAQLALLIPFYRAGETLFHHPHIPLSIPLLFARFKAGFIQFLKDFGGIAMQGIVVWLLIAPLLIATLFYLLRPGLRVLEKRVAA